MGNQNCSNARSLQVEHTYGNEESNTNLNSYSMMYQDDSSIDVETNILGQSHQQNTQLTSIENNNNNTIGVNANKKAYSDLGKTDSTIDSGIKEQKEREHKSSLCMICMMSTDIVATPCCYKSTSSLQFCGKCLYTYCSMKNKGVAPCPKCRTPITVKPESVTKKKTSDISSSDDDDKENCKPLTGDENHEDSSKEQHYKVCIYDETLKQKKGLRRITSRRNQHNMFFGGIVAHQAQAAHV